MSKVLGLDIGGTGIKGAVVDTLNGELVTERIRYKTPSPASPNQVLEVCKQICLDLEWSGPIGIGFPSTIINGVCMIATNISSEWIGVNMTELFSSAMNCEVAVINDADAAGLAELKFGAAKDISEVVLVITLGTGVGSGVFVNGKLFPNTELGLLKYKEGIVEDYVSNRIREANELSWKQWGKELNKVLKYYNKIFSPNIIVLGGGVSKKFDEYKKYIDESLNVVPAQMRNVAGVVGAAMAIQK